MVDVFRAAREAPAIVEDAIAIGAKVVWMQLGIRNDAAAAKAEAAGIEVVMNRCPKIEFGRLGGELSWSGVNSGIIRNRPPEPPLARRVKERSSPSAMAAGAVLHDMTYGFETRAVHAGAAPDPVTGARSTPIYQTAAYVFDDVDHAASLFNLHNFGYIYARLNNPTVSVLEERVASLEDGRAAVAAASGHAAQFLIFFTLLEPGDEFLASRNLYGGSLTQFGLSFKKLGWKCDFVDPADPENFRRALTAADQGDLCREPRQPRRHRRRYRKGGGDRARGRHPADRRQHPGDPLSVPAVRVGRRHRLPFDDQVPLRSRPCAGRHRRRIGPFRLGAGQPLSVADRPRAGLSRPQILREFRRFRVYHQGAGGGVARFRPDPVADERVSDPDRHRNPACPDGPACRECAARSPSFSPATRSVAWVSYAGLRDSPYHELALKYLPKGAGAVFTFGVKGGYEAGTRLVENVQLFSHLANIGDTRSLILHPASTTHRQLSDEQRLAAGAGPDVVRLSIGLEIADDLIRDLDQALAAVER